ncbi:J domain-containing protein [uncultured Sphingomonas sp.]|uniref:J domain-containing protein n=1 Tax=uncultured Sphingomonas sp. TaxID=158754 RepID=UPI002613B403|nr:J domain-containing protein [uncultured Sphingomonas sp.]
MSAPEIQPGYPLRWPEGRPRTPAPTPAAFRHDGRPITYTAAKRRLRQQLHAMSRAGKPWRTTDMILSTNIRFTAAGTRDQNVSKRDPADTGVAFYFDLDGRAHVLACDRWDTVPGNIAAIAAHIEALRGQERWGVATLRQAFAGHAALPAPGAASVRDWWIVLELPSRDATRRDVDAAYRRLAKERHPDTAGFRGAWDDLVAAYETAKLECSP